MTRSLRMLMDRRILGVTGLSRFAARGCPWCPRCGTTWAHVRGHLTYYTGGHSAYALCEPCWADLTPGRRLPYYRALLDGWKREAPADADQLEADWPAIRDAVLAGR